MRRDEKMTDRELEQKVKTAVEHIAPNTVDVILPLCTEQKQAQSAEGRKTMPLWSSMQSLYGGFSRIPGAAAAQASSLIILDVNPSVYLEVDAADQVTDVQPLNDDAAEILDELELTGIELEDAVDALIEAMLQRGYLSESQNSVLVSVENYDEGRQEELRQKVSRMIESVMEENLGENGAGASVLSQSIDEEDDELADLAGQYDISIGKAALIRKMVKDMPRERSEPDAESEETGETRDEDNVDQTEPLTLEGLAGMPVNDLALVADARSWTDVTVKRTGQASRSGLMGESAALQTALRYASVSIDQAGKVKVKLDASHGIMVYDVKLKTSAGTFKYVINAHSGELIETDTGNGCVINEVKPEGRKSDYMNTEGPYGRGSGCMNTENRSADNINGYVNNMNEYADDPDRISSVNKGYRAASGSYEGNYYRDNNGILTPVPAGAIGEEAAKTAALAHAGLRESDCLYIYAHPECDHGMMEHYDVKFVSGHMKYKYAIGVLDGAVLGRAVKDKNTKSGYVYEGNYHEHTAAPYTQTAAAQDTGQSAEAQTVNRQEAGQTLGAQTVNRQEAGQTLGAQTVNRQEAGQTLGAQTAKSQSTGQPVSAYGGAQPESAGGSMITENDALNISLKAAGLTLENLEKWKIKLVTKHGRTVYRTKLKIRGMEYEIDVDAFTGAVTKRQQEIDY